MVWIVWDSASRPGLKPACSTRKGVVGVAEVRVVEDVEELGSKTKPHAVLPGS